MTEAVRILLVEDDEDDFLLTEDYLVNVPNQSFVLSWVTTSSDAINAIRAGDFHLCLLDYLLGKETAEDVLTLFQQSNIDLPVVVLSGQSDPQIDERVMRAGATDYLSKQEIETPKFLRMLRYVLARREIEDARLARQKVELQNKAKDKFLAHLGHELRTPLASILGYTELLLSDTANQSAQQELAIIHNNGKHLLSLLNDLLDMSKIIANKFELHSRPIQLNAFLTDVYALMQISAKDKGLTLVFRSDADIPEVIFADATRLRQVLINLINNAIKFTDKGEVTLAVSMAIRAADFEQPEKHYLRFIVQDTGRGMSEDKLEMIFQPFSQIEDIMRAEQGGAGLGLAICQEIVKRMGGDITVESESGKGSLFEFIIDPGDISQQPLRPFELQRVDSQSSTKGTHVSGRVLVVDDLRELRRLTGHHIKQCGASVEFAENGSAAIHAIEVAEQQGKPFHLVLMDIHMPVMGGQEAVKQLRKQGYNLPVVALTAASHKGLFDSLMAQGFDGVVPKPVDTNLLNSVLDEYLIGEQPAQATGLPSGNSTSHNLASNSPNRILLIEDDLDATALMAILINAIGDFEVITAHNGEDAISSFKRHQGEFSYVLLDLTLPDASGYDIAEKMREVNTSTPIIVISGAEADESKMKDLNLQGALLKPISKEDLRTILMQ
ncbi:response regulator [Alteromonas oceanisediminis]|uniref:response regulator n=1 Tax=Alteromonas oceanisediminis TaxID=2836180 RepID=UPI001BDAAAC0|nr:response regulator [Alteromonas oceanisediminis]MBT0586698.1 response regulator [Alteromonas oceanisediminis]